MTQGVSGIHIGGYIYVYHSQIIDLYHYILYCSVIVWYVKKYGLDIFVWKYYFFKEWRWNVVIPGYCNYSWRKLDIILLAKRVTWFVIKCSWIGEKKITEFFLWWTYFHRWFLSVIYIVCFILILRHTIWLVKLLCNSLVQFCSGTFYIC